jgi:choline kinase
LELFSAGDFGRYADEKGEMKVCFISNNDITGGNSGSAMFNAKGELLGLAFDGNWEAMSSDIVFEPDLQRCIGVDVRYMLFIIEKYGGAANLIKELKINGSK